MTAQISMQVVHALLEEWGALLEDRIDDLLKKYGEKMKWQRSDIEYLMRYDPSRNKKYLPWIVKQTVEFGLDVHELDAMHDFLMEFERLLTLPAFEGNRDIYSYDYQSFQRVIAANQELRSRSEIERKAKEAKKGKEVEQYEHKRGVTEIAAQGDLSLLKITDAESLSWWAWRGYMQENPNWNRPTLTPPPPGTDPYSRDGKWCVRNPTHGTNYLRREPFYLVLKHGWPYVGILLSQGQVKNLDNHQVDMGVAEEIYPLLEKPIAELKTEGGTLGWEAKIFENMRFLHGGVQPGERFSSEIDLSGSSLKVLPPNLHLSSLDISHTKVTEIPDGTYVEGDLRATGTPITKIGKGLKVQGTLNLEGSALTELPEGLGEMKTLTITNTHIATLPADLHVETLNMAGTLITKFPGTLYAERITWSEPMTLKECKLLFFHMNLEKLHNEFFSHPKYTGVSKAMMEKKWKKLIPQMEKYYLTDPTIDGHVKSVYVHTTS
jgi:hypothetical protein